MCGTELESSSKTQVCGCPNQATILGPKISAVDMNEVVIIQTEELEEDQRKLQYLTTSDLEWQQQRRQRGVRKLEFEVR
tara:strand:+ start:98 stop:334 length:237 start_codon:yes stop_codon:yes gene_type:complete